jgi:hypothetical protein
VPPPVASSVLESSYVQRWEDVADGFLTRQDEVVARLTAMREAAIKERERKWEASAPKTNSKYKFAKPLPDFFTRQAMAAERTKMSFEERLEALKDL